MDEKACPCLVEAISSLRKRACEEESSGSGSRPFWQVDANASGYQWGSDGSSWNYLKTCQWCSNKMEETQFSDWQAAFAEDLQRPNWMERLCQWYNSASALLATMTAHGPKPTFDEGTLTSIQSRLEQHCMTLATPRTRSGTSCYIRHPSW